MFNQFQAELYQRLQNFELDDPSHEFGFTRHLSKNHGWTEHYAHRAIAEYKKFAFLTVVANHQIVPSDAVDSVWHAHLLLTQSYWSEFCPQILGKNLHHHPARGGKTERAEFHQLYRQTIASYQQYFGNPPQDIWSPPDVRFGKELKMQRIGTVDNWIISKSSLRKYLPRLSFTAIAIALVLVFITIDSSYATSVAGRSNSLSLSSYWCLLLPAVIGLILRHHIRQPSQQPQKPQLDLYQLAYLSGGRQRAVELAIAKLVYQGYLLPNVRHRTFAIAKSLKPEANYLEHQVMARVRKTPEFKSLKRIAVYSFKQIDPYQTSHLRTHLQQSQLLIEKGSVIVVRNFANYLPILFFSYVFTSILLESLPTERLLTTSQVSLLLQGISIMVACLIVYGGRTRWGDRVLRDIRRNHHSFDPIQRFALYGELALSGGALDDLKQIYYPQPEADTGGCGCGC